MRYDDGIPERESPDGAYVHPPDRMDRFVEQILTLRAGGPKPKPGIPLGYRFGFVKFRASGLGRPRHYKSGPRQRMRPRKKG